MLPHQKNFDDVKTLLKTKVEVSEGIYVKISDNAYNPEFMYSLNSLLIAG